MDLRRFIALGAIVALVTACGAPPAASSAAATAAAVAVASVAATAPAATASAQPTGTPVAASAQPTATPALWSSMPAPADAGVAGAEWIAIPMPGGRTSRAAVFRPAGAGPFPVVLVWHGTEGFKTKHVQLAADLAPAGVVAVATCWYAGNYEGPTSGPQAQPPTTALDGVTCPGGPDFTESFTSATMQGLRALVAAARSLPGGRADRVGLLGHSRGSVAAIAVAATTPGIGAVVAAAGYPDPAVSYLATLSTPVLMLQGTDDDFYPNDAQQPRAFEKAMVAAGKNIRSRYFDGAPHHLAFLPPWHDEVVRLASAFFKERLAP